AATGGAIAVRHGDGAGVCLSSTSDVDTVQHCLDFAGISVHGLTGLGSSDVQLAGADGRVASFLFRTDRLADAVCNSVFDLVRTVPGTLLRDDLRHDKLHTICGLAYHIVGRAWLGFAGHPCRRRFDYLGCLPAVDANRNGLMQLFTRRY